MSQIASFAFLKASDTPFLGFWSKPKPRLFRQPECKFNELLKQHALRDSVFERADGVYVALVFAWLEAQDGKLSGEADPVLGTVRKRISGSHWLVKFADQGLVEFLDTRFPESEWPSFLRKVGAGAGNDLEWTSFDDAKRFVRSKFLEMRSEEALFISVG